MNCLQFNYKNCCRICADNSIETYNLFEIRHRGTKLAEMISFCTHLALQESDVSRPSNICRPCIESLRTAYEFCKLAKASERKFHEFNLLQPSATVFMQPKIESVLVNEEEEEGIENIDFKADFNNFDSPAMIDECLKVEIKEENYAMDMDEPFKLSRPKVKRKNPPQESSKLILTTTKRQENVDVSKRVYKSWQCYKCHADICRLESLRLHMKKHIEATPHECTVCGLYFSKRRFDRHLCKGKSVQCEYCTETFNSTVKILEHLECDHKDGQIMNRCTHCRKSYPMRELYEFHTRYHFIKSIFCEICNRAFDTNIALNSHRTYMHRKSRCNFVF